MSDTVLSGFDLLIYFMKKFLAVCLLLMTLPACAQGWVRYAQSEGATHYFDSLRTRKMGDTAFVWDLHDLTTGATGSDGISFRSSLFALEYNCRARQYRVLSSAQMDGAMGTGSVVQEKSGAGAWTDAAAESLRGRLFNHICE